MRAVAHEVDHWRHRAALIPDPRIRADALDALARKRPHLDGAALFWILPRRRHRRLLRLLVTYEFILEFLDNMNERAVRAAACDGRRPAVGVDRRPGRGDDQDRRPGRGDDRGACGGVDRGRGVAEGGGGGDGVPSRPGGRHDRGGEVVDGRQLHLALIEALDPGGPISDYHRDHPWRDDGGYLHELVLACRGHCQSLAHFPRVRALALREARRTQVLALNHDPEPRRRELGLRRWVAQEFPGDGRASWFELSGAATAPLTIHMLLALAAEPLCSEVELRRACEVYFPGLSLIATMLDSYVDQAEDAVCDSHSYIAHYQTSELANRRLLSVIAGSVTEARQLRRGTRHVVVAACMIAMYLSNDTAREPARRQVSRELAHAGGLCTRLLLPVLRLWRRAYALRDA